MMEQQQQRTWPYRSSNSRYAALPLSKELHQSKFHSRKYDSNTSSSLCRQIRYCSSSSPPSKPSSKSHDDRDFSNLPYDILTKIAANFKHPTLQAASSVCKTWKAALQPLREAMLFLRWGKRFKHGRDGVVRNLDKALDSFLKGAARGSTLAMVDAGLMYWEMGKKEEGLSWYLKAAVLGDPAGQCNLGISYLQLEPPNHEEAVKWLYKASFAGHVRAQYQLALCLHQGCGTGRSLREAAKWYLKAAEGGYVRAMYNVSLCYSVGEGLRHSSRRARAWMRRAADHGHSKAQFEHGLRLFSGTYDLMETLMVPLGQEGQMIEAAVLLELATRAGERAAAHIKDVILLQLSSTQRAHIMLLADNWRALPSSH